MLSSVRSCARSTVTNGLLYACSLKYGACVVYATRLGRVLCIDNVCTPRLSRCYRSFTRSVCMWSAMCWDNGDFGRIVLIDVLKIFRLY